MIPDTPERTEPERTEPVNEIIWMDEPEELLEELPTKKRKLEEAELECDEFLKEK